MSYFDTSRVMDHRRDQIDYQSINLGFSDLAIKNSIAEELKNNLKYKITAVLLNWKRLDGIQKLVNILSRTAIFEEIIVWNNNPDIFLKVEDFSNISRVALRLENSKLNLKDESKYRACAMAANDACFYIDDDFNPSRYLNSLVASFRSDPLLLHAVTDDYTFYTNLIWTYFDKSIDLHTGFSWIGSGSIFLKRSAQRHLELLHRYLANDTELISFADLFFSVWLNQVPVQMNTLLNPLPSDMNHRKSVSFSGTDNFFKLQFKSTVKAISILERELRSKSTDQPTFSRENQRQYPSYIKSSSLKDNFVFYTNILPFDFENIPFNISNDYKRGTRENLPHGAAVNYFTTHATLRAVDQIPSTCWTHTKPIGIGQFFAIDLLRIRTNITLLFTVKHDRSLYEKLEVSVSLNGIHWIPYRSLNGIFLQSKSRLWSKSNDLYLIVSSKFNHGFSTFRYIKYEAVKETDLLFDVCEIELIDHEKDEKLFSMNDFYPLTL